jgi:hypothetical protein
MPKMNVTKQLLDGHLHYLHDHADRSTFGKLEALLHSSMALLDAFDINKEDTFCFGDANDLSSAPLHVAAKASKNSVRLY